MNMRTIIKYKEELPEPKLFTADNKLFLMMEHGGKKAYERIPLAFLKLNDVQKKWLLANLKVVPKLFKKLGIRYAGEE